MKRKNVKKTAISFMALVMISTAFCTTVYAEDQKREQKGPPPEAYEACKGKEVGYVTVIKGREGESLEATCEEMKGKLVAVPVNPPARKKKG